MVNLAEELLNDKAAGLQIDATGRRFFRPRRVTFQTITIRPEDIHRAGWLEYEEELKPIDWQGPGPSHADLRNFAISSSQRFLAFWYRVFDVAIARALCGHGKEIFQTDFYQPTTFVDTGIPARQEHSTVQATLHQKILKEYKLSQYGKLKFRIFYISTYLQGLTDDIRNILSPYNELWNYKKIRFETLQNIEKTFKKNITIFQEIFRGTTLDRFLTTALDRSIHEHLLRLLKNSKIRDFETEAVRYLLYRVNSGISGKFQSQEISDILRYHRELRLPHYLIRVYKTLQLPDRIYSLTRSAAALSSAVYRLDLRLARLKYLHRRSGMDINLEVISNRRNDYLKRFEKRLFPLKNELVGEAELENLKNLHSLHNLLSGSETDDPDVAAGDILKKYWDADDNSIFPTNQKEIRDMDNLKICLDLLVQLREAEVNIVKLYSEHAEKPAAAIHRAESNSEILQEDGWRYSKLSRFDLSDEYTVGNPFHENIILNHARSVILRRLRPIRMTASYYSLIPGHRHGAMTLNPIMKLWKDRPNTHDICRPGLAQQEINTRFTMECLIRLAMLVDRKLGRRRVNRGIITRNTRGIENLRNLTFLLLPGSCFPLREIHRYDFPEFRGRIIGESRSPHELGVEPGEDAVLTGAWYQKNNHTLYYPVGGDNGQLVNIIYQSGRSPGPPAFFFALGQFVHDCLKDNQVYYRTGEKTFRECVEEYYIFEDRIRKNRGEKTGRRKLDNSRPAIRFMFAVYFSRLITEALTGSSQSHFRHPPSEKWINRNLQIPLLSSDDRSLMKRIRIKTRSIIEEYDRSLNRKSE